MRELPEGNDLLSIARKVLLNNLMPLLPVARRYDVLMVANAMGIAMRQMSMGNEIAKQNRQVQEGLIANEGVTDDHDYEIQDYTMAYWALCTKIREGDFDPGTADRTALLDFLHDLAIQRLRESAPKLLETVGKN